MTFDELKSKVEAGEIDIPFEIDEETDELILNVDTSDQESMERVREFLASEGIELPDPDSDIDIHEGYESGIEPIVEEDDPTLPEFDVMTLMVSNMEDDALIDYVRDLVCSGIYDVTTNGGPTALQEMGLKLREDWDINWDEVIDTQDFEGKVRYMLGQFPPDKLRSVAETALKRAILIMLSEGSDYVTPLMAQMAAQLVVSNDPEQDSENPLLAG